MESFMQIMMLSTLVYRVETSILCLDEYGKEKEPLLCHMKILNVVDTLLTTHVTESH
jgi:hypothetical protein